jgi:hypothetical protein
MTMMISYSAQYPSMLSSPCFTMYTKTTKAKVILERGIAAVLTSPAIY